MRREIHWTHERDDQTYFEVRVGFFGKKYKFQYREKDAEVWDYKRKPTHEDLLKLLDIIQRRYQRRQAGPDELAEAKRLIRIQEGETSA